MKTAVLDTWTESEAGWGQKPDGCSIHLTREDYKKYVEHYWSKMPAATPDVYERPDNSLREIVVSDELFKKLEESNGGFRLWQSELRELKEKNEILFKD